MSRPDPLATHARALAQFEDGRLEEADATCRAALKRDKKALETWALLGAVSMRRQDYAQAERAYGRCVELSPRDPRSMVLAGNAVALQGRFDEALRMYDEALRLEPGAAKASEWKAKVLEWSGRHDEARRALAPFREGGGETPPMAEVQARVEMHAKDHEAALAAIDRHWGRPDLSPEMRHRLGHLRDLYGYDSKEEILGGVVTLLKGQTRSSDFLGRMADDRLLAVVPHTTPEGAQVLAERLLSGSREIEFFADGRAIQITLSIGASHNAGGATLFFDAMLQSAEEALVDASQAGGDRYLAYEPGGSPR